MNSLPDLIRNIINEAKAGRTIAFDGRSQKVSIMVQGTLRCIGPQLRLKEKYGRGFKLSFSGQAANMGELLGMLGMLGIVMLWRSVMINTDLV